MVAKGGYFPDRLPIASVSGVLRITYKTLGLGKLFEEGKHLFYFNSADEALILARSLIKKADTALNQMGQNARFYVMDRFSEITRFKIFFKWVMTYTTIKIKRY